MVRRNSAWPKAYRRWNDRERDELVRLVLQDNLTFDHIASILGRSPRALKLEFCNIIEAVDWSSLSPAVPAAVDPSLDDVARLVIAGESPADIAIKFPTLFIEYVDGIIQLWQVIHKKQWRFRP